jgi:hypothetical protein
MIISVQQMQADEVDGIPGCNMPEQVIDRPIISRYNSDVLYDMMDKIYIHFFISKIKTFVYLCLII